jgi:hypothetical protein
MRGSKKRKEGGGKAGILTEHDALNPASWGQAVGATRNGVKCP